MDMKKLFFMFVMSMVVTVASMAQDVRTYAVRGRVYNVESQKLTVSCTDGTEFNVYNTNREYVWISQMVPGGIYEVTTACEQVVNVRLIGTDQLYVATPTYVVGYPSGYYYGGYYGGEPRHHGKASRTAAKVAAGAAGVAVIAGVLSAILK